MKKKYIFVIICCFSLLFMGCPYNSEMPIDNPAVQIDTRLIGKWQERNSDDVTYIVTKKDEFTYSIKEKHKPSENYKPEDDKTYNGYLSDINDTKFMNLYEVGQDSKSYYFYKIEFSTETDGFTLFPVTEYITEKFTSSEDLKKFFAQYKNLSFFYETKDEYIKVGK